jgi:hypothetical protein
MSNQTTNKSTTSNSKSMSGVTGCDTYAGGAAPVLPVGAQEWMKCRDCNKVECDCPCMGCGGAPRGEDMELCYACGGCKEETCPGCPGCEEEMCPGCEEEESQECGMSFDQGKSRERATSLGER